MNFMKNIEFLRIVFTLIIVYQHMIRVYLVVLFPDLYGDQSIQTERTHLLVDFFFLLSGFFLYSSEGKYFSWKSFVLKKIIRLWPVFAFSIIIGMFHKESSTTYDVYILDLLLMQGNGLLLSQGYNFNAWFVSSLFWALAAYFYIIKNYEKKNVNLCIIILIYISLYCIAHKMADIYTNCIFRAFSGIGIGYFIGCIFSKNTDTIESIKSKIFYSITEISLVYFIARYSIGRRADSVNYCTGIVLFSALLWCFLIKGGVISKLTNFKIISVCGKYTYSTYIMQNLSFCVSKRYIWDNKEFVISHHNLAIILGMIIAIMLGIVTYYVIEKPFYGFLHSRLKDSTRV
jgi:peptidoglycan/LPS O-acetylase OafA/YrhL